MRYGRIVPGLPPGERPLDEEGVEAMDCTAPMPRHQPCRSVVQFQSQSSIVAKTVSSLFATPADRRYPVHLGVGECIPDLQAICPCVVVLCGEVVLFTLG